MQGVKLGEVFSNKEKNIWRTQINDHEIDNNNKNFNDFCSGVNKSKKGRNLNLTW
jgi:hypothetical protein